MKMSYKIALVASLAVLILVVFMSAGSESKPEADAQSAIDDLDGKDLDGRNLKVNEAQERQPRGGGGGGGGRRGGGGGGGGYGGGGGGGRW